MNLKQKLYALSPGMRGAIFYGVYWGIIGLYDPFLYVHFANLGVTKAQIGILGAIFPFFNLVVAPMASRYADRHKSRRKILVLALIGHGLTTLLMVFPRSIETLALGLAAMTLCRAPIISLADSMIAQMASKNQIEYGRMRLWGSIIYTIVATSIGLVWAQTGYLPMFVVTGLLLLPLSLVGFLLEEPEHAPLLAETPEKKEKFALPEKGTCFLLGAAFILGAAMFMTGIFSSVYMTSIGGNSFYVGAMMGVSALLEIPAMALGNKAVRRLGETNTLLLSYAINGLGTLGFAFSTSPNLMLLAGAMRGFGFGLYFVSTVTILNKRAPAHLKSTYQSLIAALSWGLAPLISGPISGLIYEQGGAFTLFCTSASLSLLAMLIILPTYWIWKKKPETV